MTAPKFPKAKITSPDMNADRLEKLRRIFPDLIDGGGKLNEQALRQLIPTEGSGRSERYGFEWLGKQASKRQAFTPSRATLVADRERSKNFDATNNLMIVGDNLESLKLLQSSYFEKIKCIYIDPPYNTGKDFIYSDNFGEEKSAYWKKNGVVQDGVKLVALTEANGRRHSKWLNMMQSRLYAARSLLHREGVLIVHIDEHEGHRLRILLEEVFGSENFLGEIVWDKRNPKGLSGKISYQHESILLFAKDFDQFKERNRLQVLKKNAQSMLKAAAKYFSYVGRSRIPPKVSKALQALEMPTTTEHARKYTLADANEDYQSWLSKRSNKLTGGEAMYKFIDASGRVYQTVSMAAPDKPATRSHQPFHHPATGKPCPVPAKGWRNPPKRMKQLLDEGRIEFGVDETTQPRRKYFLDENLSENLTSLLYYGASDDGLLKKLGIPFDNPKPVEVAKHLMSGVVEQGDWVLDFFAGSGTTGHAVMEMNAESGIGAQFILVQVPEYTDADHAAHQAGYKTISDLCIDRLKKAGKMVYKDSSKESDIGFRVYHLADSHFPENLFEPDPKASNEENVARLDAYLSQAGQPTLFDANEDRDGIITEISLKNGFGLLFKLVKESDKFPKNTVYRLSGHDKETLLCLDRSLHKDTVDQLAEQHAESQLILSIYAPSTAQNWVLHRAFRGNLRTI